MPRTWKAVTFTGREALELFRLLKKIDHATPKADLGLYVKATIQTYMARLEKRSTGSLQ